MSVNSKMTAIADKIRSLRGITGKLGVDAMATNLATLQSQITAALTTLANMGVSVPSGATAGNLSELIATLTPKFTNVIRKAVDTSKNPYNGGTGWKADTYLSWDGKTESSSTNYDVTGFIPAKIGDVVRLKNVQLCKTVNGNSKCIIAYYKSDFAHLSTTDWLKTPASLSAAWNVVTNDSGTDVIQFTVPTSLNASLAYIRLCCGSLTDASIITINEEI